MSAVQVDPVKLERRRALQRAGMATAAALVLLIGVLVIEDGREPETTVPVAADEGVVREVTVSPQTGGVSEVPAASAAIGVASPQEAATSSAVVVDGAADGPAAPIVAVEQTTAQVGAQSKVQHAEPPAPAAKPAPPLPDGYLIQLGVFGAMANADALRADVEARGLPVRVEGRVVVGPFRDKAAADAARDRLRREGLPAGLVVPPRKGSPVVRAEK